MQYEYQNASGQVRTIEQRMTDEHPETIGFNTDGSWYPLNPRSSLSSTDDGSGPYTRVYGGCEINAHPATGKFPYVSRSLGPKIGKDLAPDRDRRGLPVIYNREQERRIAKETGFVKEA